MPDAGTVHIRASAPGATSQSQQYSPVHSWRALLWKLALVALLLIVVLFGVPAADRDFLFLLSTTIILWGALFVAGALWNLLVTPDRLRLAWVALALGAYAVLAIPPITTGDATRMLDALGPVVALTLAAQLGRRDLAGAFRDWASILGLGLYAALGMVALWSILPFGPTIITVAVLLPPIVSEVALLLLRRSPRMSEVARYVVAALVAALLSTVVISFTQYNIRTPAEWRLFFSVAVGVLIGGALLVSLLTRPLFATSSGPVRALVELTHGALLIGLAVYVPIRLFAL